MTVWRAWLLEWDVQNSTNVSAEHAMECAFDYAARVNKAGTVPKGCGAVLRRVVRVFSLSSYKQQQEGKVWYLCPELCEPALRTKLIELGVLTEENVGSCEAADLGLAGSEEVNGGRDADSGSGSDVGGVIICEAQSEDNPMRRCRSVLGLGSGAGGGGDEARERSCSPGGASGCGAGDSEGDGHRRGGGMGCDTAGEGDEGAGGGFNPGMRDGGGGRRGVGGDTINSSGGSDGLAVCEEELPGRRRVCAVQGVHGGWVGDRGYARARWMRTRRRKIGGGQRCRLIYNLLKPRRKLEIKLKTISVYAFLNTIATL